MLFAALHESQDSDRLGALVFFIVVGFPVVIVGLALIARYIVSGT
jgi:hypothetical protein